MDMYVRTQPEVEISTDPVISEAREPNNIGAESNVEDIRPVDDMGDNVVLESLGLGDALTDLPEKVQGYLGSIKDHVNKIIEKRGLAPTVGNFAKVIDGLKEEMGIDDNADPVFVIDRIGGVINAWRDLSFIKSPEDKRKVFMKLARMDSVSDMNRYVFEEMERRGVWQG